MPINRGKVDAAINSASFALAARLDQEFTNQISSEKWDWTDGDLRDIVDTGRLRASQQWQVVDGRITFSWPVDYAAEVALGAALKDGRELPARNWVQAGLDAVEADVVFGDALRRALG